MLAVHRTKLEAVVVVHHASMQFVEKCERVSKQDKSTNEMKALLDSWRSAREVYFDKPNHK